MTKEQEFKESPAYKWFNSLTIKQVNILKTKYINDNFNVGGCTSFTMKGIKVMFILECGEHK